MTRTRTDDNGKEVTFEEVHLAEGLFIQSDIKLVDAYYNFLKSLKLEPQMVDFNNNMADAAQKISE